MCKWGCAEEETEVGRKRATGACPYCGGEVEAVDVRRQRWCCFLLLCFRFKRNYVCTLCSRNLVLYDS